VDHACGLEHGGGVHFSSQDGLERGVVRLERAIRILTAARDRQIPPFHGDIPVLDLVALLDLDEHGARGSLEQLLVPDLPHLREELLNLTHLPSFPSRVRG
jgi:hypothetical protein